MKPQKLPFSSFVQGDCFVGIPSVIIKINDAPPASPLERVIMGFKKIKTTGTEQVVEISSDIAEEIQIVSSANWEVTVPEQIIPGLAEGNWLWQMRFIAEDGCSHTYLGDEITVLETAFSN